MDKISMNLELVSRTAIRQIFVITASRKVIIRQFTKLLAMMFGWNLVNWGY